MPEYYYRGRDRQGDLRQGERFSESVDSLGAALVTEGLIPIEIRLKNNQSIRAVEDLIKHYVKPKLDKSELSILMRQMQLLSEAHVPLLTGFNLLAEHSKNETLRSVLKGVCTQLEKGKDLSSALRTYSDIFTPFMISMIEIGERTGNLSNTFLQIHEYMEFEISSMNKFKETLRYPVMLFLTLLATILSINIFVIPTFAKVYSQLQTDLPWQTRLLISSSNFVIHDGIYVLIGLGVGAYFLLRYLRTARGKLKYHTLILRVPLIGNILRKIILIRFSKTLAIVLDSGMTLIDGLRFTGDIVMNEYVKLQILDACELIERGNGFVAAISKLSIFSPLEAQMMIVGEQNGKLGPALQYISFFHSNEMNYELKRLHEILGPLMVACFSVVILIVALGVYLPLWNLSSAVH